MVEEKVCEPQQPHDPFITPQHPVCEYPIVRKRAVLLDVDYVLHKGKPRIRLIMKGKKTFQLYDPTFQPYFYFDGEFPPHFSDTRIERKEEITKVVMGKEKRVWKITVSKPSDVPPVSEALMRYGECYEYDIPFSRRYLIDKDLYPFMEVVYERRGRELLTIVKKRKREVTLSDFSTLIFDIETYNPEGVPRKERDPIVMIGCEENGSLPFRRFVLTWKKIPLEIVETCHDEKEMLERFVSLIAQKDVDIIFGYNSSAFDLDYLKARAETYNTTLSLGRDGSEFRIVRKGFYAVAKITGRTHIDVYPLVRFFGQIGSLKITSFTLGDVYAEMTGDRKFSVEKRDIWELWEKDPQTLATYCAADVMATSEIVKRFVPTVFALSYISGLPLFDVASATSGQIVEMILLRAAAKRNMVAPNKPRQYRAEPIQGAYVKLPEPGIYENIIVFDFRGLYPSIIISHNIDPFTIDTTSEDAFVSPLGHRFDKKQEGLVPFVLRSIVEKRGEYKDKLKTLPKGTEEYEKVYAMQQALKIIANSFYGYLLYANSRWYSRRCGESTTAWGRYYIQETAKKAEEAGFRVLYSDTDSLFLLLGNKTKEDALEFMRKINEQLPGTMELEYENFYPRGVFVSKKGADLGAKKKYALLGEDGTIKIRGFELVRRDWSRIAKETQRKVLEIILKEGSKEKAAALVKEVIHTLREGKVPLSDLVIYSQLRKNPGTYEVTSPELAAAQKARARGKSIERGALVGYVITKRGKSVSDRAELAEYATDYDASYYIEHQVLPAVMKILEELGFSEEELKGYGKQQTLEF